MRAPLTESRLPVGSSAIEQGRVVHDGPGNRGALHLAAGQLRRAMVEPMRQAQRSAHCAGGREGIDRGRRRPAAAAARCFRPGQRRQQIEELEHEPDALAPHPRQRLVGQRVESQAVEQ